MGNAIKDYLAHVNSKIFQLNLFKEVPLDILIIEGIFTEIE